MDTQQEINQRLIDLALQLGATKASIVKVANITFSADFRQLCEMNSCGLYGQCWMLSLIHISARTTTLFSSPTTSPVYW